MRMLMLIVAVSLLSCGQSSPDEKKEAATTDSINKPIDTARTTPVVKETAPSHSAPDEAAVNEALKAVYGNDWHVLNDQEAKWMKDAFDYFIVPKRKEDPNYPYIAKGDFNGDSKPDTAAVVTDAIKKNFRVAIVLGPDNIKLWEEDIMIDAAISAVPKSTVQGSENERPKKIKMKGDGINVEYFEKASFVLYWDRSSFKRIQTGD